jgi:hypothetical protein
MSNKTAEKEKMLVIIDADPIVYRAGFAGESHERHVVWSQHGEDFIKDEIFVPGETTAYKQMKEWMAEIDDLEILSDETVVIPEPLDHVLSTVKKMLQETLHAIAEHYGLDIFDLSYRVLLSGPGNFRIDLATVLPYKGNRKDSHKPHWYQQIRNYLTDQWDAEVIEGREADDECAILSYAHGANSVICTIDKDLDQVPGNHYDYVRKTHYQVGQEEGDLLFYKQILSGDSTDNIPGIYKVGAVRAANIVDSVYLEYELDHGRIWEAILEAYDHSITQYGEKCPYFELASKEGVEAVAIEMARLVKMQEYEGQLWTPPGQPDLLLEDKESE